MEMKRISKLEDTTMQFNQHEQQREVRMKEKKKKNKNKNRALVSCGIITIDPIFLLLESQNKKRKRMKFSMKNYWLKISQI